MNLFAKPDHEQLVAPPDLFDREQLVDEHGAWGHQLLRAATAMETLAQITNRDATVLLKGGTLLQHSLAWPPYRASVDLDLETGDADDLQAVLGQMEGAFSRSEIAVDVQETPLPGFVAYVDFPRTTGQEWSLRVDALEHDAWPSRSGPWTDIPAPWSDATPPQAAEAEVQAAQKLLMASDPPYGRDLGDHLGRQNFVKDLFDLRCLGHEHLEEQHLAEAAPEDIERKSGYLGESFDPEAVLGQARDTFRAFAPPPVNDDSLRGSLWRAYDRVKGAIRVPFTRADVRTAAGCAHHVVQALERHQEDPERIDWEDAWRPLVAGEPRKGWEEKPIQPVVEVEDGYGPATGPLEAWAEFEP